MACDDVYRRDTHYRLWWVSSSPRDAPPAPTPLADVAAVQDAAAGHGRPFGLTPPAEGDTPC